MIRVCESFEIHWSSSQRLSDSEYSTLRHSCLVNNESAREICEYVNFFHLEFRNEMRFTATFRSGMMNGLSLATTITTGCQLSIFTNQAKTARLITSMHDDSVYPKFSLFLTEFRRNSIDLVSNYYVLRVLKCDERYKKKLSNCGLTVQSDFYCPAQWIQLNIYMCVSVDHITYTKHFSLFKAIHLESYKKSG